MLYMTVSGLVLNPRHLRGLMDEMQARELLLPSAAYAIVDRAIVRDPAVFPRSWRAEQGVSRWRARLSRERCGSFAARGCIISQRFFLIVTAAGWARGC